jgi:long-chain fatty acid transport protein
MEMNRSRIACVVCSAIAALGVAAESRASGFALHEQGASGLGNAYAGAAAVAEDATTVWWNPAGMARLAPGKHFSIGGVYIDPSTSFTNNGSTIASASNPARTGNGGDAGKDAIVPNMFFAMDLNQRWNLGVAVSSPFGLKTEYDPTWIGRFQGISSQVKTINVNPAVSFKLSDSASIGGGISYQYGKVDLLTAANYSAVAFGAGGAALLGAVGGAGVEGQNKTSVDGDAWGFNVGGLFNVGTATRFGVHYRSSLKYNLHGTTTFTGAPAAFGAIPALAAATSNGNAALSLRTPDDLAFSVAHKLNDRWELLGDVTWTHWARIKSLPVLRDSGATVGTPLTFNFRDSWRLSAGANYRMDPKWTLKMGVAYDQTPVPNDTSRSVRLPDSDRYWLSFGAKYQLTARDALDFGYTYITARDTNINNNQAASGLGIITGTYKAHVHLLGLQYQHTF